MGEEGFRSAIKRLIHFSIAWCNGKNKKKVPLVTSKRCPHFIYLFFPKMNTTVKIHRAQRVHVCSTRHTLYKLDMENSTERLNPAVLPPRNAFQRTRRGAKCCSGVPSRVAMSAGALRFVQAQQRGKSKQEEVQAILPTRCLRLVHALVFTQGLPPPILEVGS